MVVLGRDQNSIQMMTYSNPALNFKSLFVDYNNNAHSEPLNTAIFDDMDNLNVMINSEQISLDRLKDKLK